MSDTPPLRLPNRVSGPPGGWCYTVPETRQRFTSLSMHDLRVQVAAHYRANSMNVPETLDALIEAAICAGAPGYCEDVSVRPRALTLGKVATVAFQLALHGTRRLLGLEALVPQAQAEARASVCATHVNADGTTGCPENVPLAGCSTCNQRDLRELVARLRGRRTTSHDASLRTCRVCLCDLQAKVHMPLDRLLKMTTDAELAALPVHCWMLVERDAALSSPSS